MTATSNNNALAICAGRAIILALPGLDLQANSVEVLATIVGVTLRNVSRQWKPSASDGNDSASTDERVASLRTISPWKLRARFVFLLLPLVLIGRGTPTRLIGYALAAGEWGNERIAAWCWHRVLSTGIRAPQAYESVVARCLDAREPRTAAAFALAVYDECGFSPAEAVRLFGELLLQDAGEPALRIYERLLERCSGDIHSAVPAPVPRRLLDGDDLRTLLAERAGDPQLAEVESGELDLEVARLCFRYSEFVTAARLFERSVGARFDREDQIAYAFALVKNGSAGSTSGISEGIKADVRAADIGVDWRVLFATVLFADRSMNDTVAVVESALKSRFREHPDIANVLDHCRRIVECLSSRRDICFRVSASCNCAAANPGAGRPLRKIFVCGNGWSGSGALYDALTEYDCVAEVPDAPIDHHINACTGDETMFVQGDAGLGRIWRLARDEQRLSRMDLWELFRCHVIGAGGIGHAEHKSVNAAANLLERLGSRYTAVFLDLFEAIAALPEDTRLGELHSILVHTTEALALVVTGARDGQSAIFNNAMFGPNIDMVEIFSGFRLAVVVRDPLDQYADRRSQDLKHWMSARRFVPFYRSSRKAFQQRKRSLHTKHAGQVREVEFERFVRDATYRDGVIDWMLDGCDRRRIRRSFDSERSQRNIGIYRQMLSGDEIEIIGRELRQWRRT